MAANGALPQTLRSITATKISELSKQRALFDQHKAEIINAAASAPNLRAKAQTLLEGVAKLKGHANDAFDRDQLDESDLYSSTFVENGSERATHINIRRFLFQGQYDPSVSEWTLKNWIGELEQEILQSELKHEHASFYSGLVTEWLANLDGQGDSNDSATANSGRAEMQEQRATWEEYVFNAGNVNTDGIRAYLDSLFTDLALPRQELDILRQRIKRFGEDLSTQQKWFTVDDLKWSTKALLKSDILTKEKTVILKEFMRNPAVTQEVVDVLNMRLASLDSWGWPANEGIAVEMRRQLNGKYRVYMDEDLLDGIMFQYLGLQWAVKFRDVFETFLNSRAWTSLREYIPKSERDRRRYYSLDNHGILDDSRPNVNQHRQETYKREYFMTQLPRSVDGDLPDYDGGDSASSGKNAVETKHSLLHLLITESMIHSSLHGHFTAIRSDFKWFGPSLPHDTILTALSYFGVPDNWLRFFKTFLEMPLKFVQDGPDATVRVRQRGVPMSHSLSDCFGEVVLFCMDYAVNKNTSGAFIYRLHDDFWFWGKENTCVKAWNAMSDFASTMGLEFNDEKTGVMRLTTANNEATQGSPSERKAEADTTLPVGDIRWGFLKLDAQEGRFVIDQGQVDNHIAELERQLSSCTSVFAWVQAWNTYFARFFPNNFAKPAMCFGRDHIDMAISTLSRIERTLFASTTGVGSGVTDYLRKVIADRFGIHDLPEGFFYFPIELGGLELINPYIPLLAMRENIRTTPQRRLQKASVQDEANYHAAKERFEKSGSHSSTYNNLFRRGSVGSSDDDSASTSSPSRFLTLEEYKRYPETHSHPLLTAYKDLIGIPGEAYINQSPSFRGTQSTLRQDLGIETSANKISDSWSGMSPYWRWVAELYHAEMKARFGSLAAVNREFMPLGVVKTLKEGKMRWEN